VPCRGANFGYHRSVLSQTIIPKSKGTSKATKTSDGIEVAARYFAYKLYEATDGQPMQWQLLHGMGESAATISRAVERGWVILQHARGKPLDRLAALTDEGRHVARKGRWNG
jgi:hypothetical protein